MAKDNYQRSGRMADLVLVYQQRHDSGEDEQTVAEDMLTDMRHWADVYGVDFYAALDASYQHYLAEKVGA